MHVGPVLGPLYCFRFEDLDWPIGTRSRRPQESPGIPGKVGLGHKPGHKGLAHSRDLLFRGLRCFVQQTTERSPTTYSKHHSPTCRQPRAPPTQSGVSGGRPWMPPFTADWGVLGRRPPHRSRPFRAAITVTTLLGWAGLGLLPFALSNPPGRPFI